MAAAVAGGRERARVSELLVTTSVLYALFIYRRPTVGDGSWYCGFVVSHTHTTLS